MAFSQTASINVLPHKNVQPALSHTWLLQHSFPPSPIRRHTVMPFSLHYLFLRAEGTLTAQVWQLVRGRQPGGGIMS